MATRRSQFSFLYACAFLVLLSSFLLSPVRADTTAFQTYTQKDGLAFDYVTSIAFTPDGALWVGTPRGATNVQTKYWVTYTDALGLGSSSISAVAVTTDGKVYFATDGGGLTLFGPTRKTYNTANSAIPSDYLTAVAADQKNRIWVGTFGSGVSRLEGTTWTTYTLASNYINALTLDRNGNPWVATDDGAFFYNGQSWTHLTQKTGLASSRVNAIAAGPDGKIWFGTDDGVTAYDGRRYETWRQADGLAGNIVRAVVVDSQNRVWIGTTMGLSLLDGENWKTYTRADGLADDEVTALALDAQDAVWAGTAHGLSTMNPAYPRATSLPVVLVHGWHGPDSDRIEDSEFRFLKNYMQRDGIAPFYAAGISPYHTLYQNAATLKNVIADVKARTGAPRVDILAFSMGGLNTRAYLESTLYQNDVRRAIILGTPQAGVELWYPLLTREIEDRPTEPSAIELTPQYADLFNRTHSPRLTVPYDLLVGDARTQPGLELLKVFPPSDGLISESSAHALAGPLVRQEVNSDVHAWNPAPLPFQITSYLYPEQTYDHFLRNAFRDPEVRPIGFSAESVPAIPPRNITPMNVDTLQAGDVVTRMVDIDTARAVRFISRWNAGDFALTLRAPNGITYTPEDFHQAAYLRADIGSFISYSVPTPQVGTWQLVIQRTDKGTEPATVTTYADLDATLTMAALTDHPWYPLGASVVISATLSNHARGLDVQARIEWLGDGISPRGSPTEVKLLEEGAPGTYAEALTNLTRGGYYMARITARGDHYAREREVIFAVSPSTARFTGKPQSQAEGTPGHYSALTIQAPVDVTRTGLFGLGATLRDAQGHAVLSLTAPQDLAQGTQTVTIRIPGRDLQASGLDGPYTIDLMLLDTAWAAVQLDTAPQAITTEAYKASDFSE